MENKNMPNAIYIKNKPIEVELYEIKGMYEDIFNGNKENDYFFNYNSNYNSNNSNYNSSNIINPICNNHFKTTIETTLGCIHSEKDCKILIEKIINGKLNPIKKRLNEREKMKIRPGSIFVYAEEDSCIKRWTDKKEWTPSRVQGVFLVYKELKGRLFKKTYTERRNGKTYHVVAYSLKEWEERGECFCNKL